MINNFNEILKLLINLTNKLNYKEFITNNSISILLVDNNDNIIERRTYILKEKSIGNLEKARNLLSDLLLKRIIDMTICHGNSIIERHPNLYGKFNEFKEDIII